MRAACALANGLLPPAFSWSLPVGGAAGLLLVLGPAPGRGRTAAAVDDQERPPRPAQLEGLQYQAARVRADLGGTVAVLAAQASHRPADPAAGLAADGSRCLPLVRRRPASDTAAPGCWPRAWRLRRLGRGPLPTGTSPTARRAAPRSAVCSAASTAGQFQAAVHPCRSPRSSISASPVRLPRRGGVVRPTGSAAGTR
jgi:hypothetical protein